MLAAIGFKTAMTYVGVEQLTELPPSPARRWSGFLVRCKGKDRVALALDSSGRIRVTRPVAPIGLVTDLARIIGPVVSQSNLRVRPVVEERAIRPGVLPKWLVDEIKAQSVATNILEEWIERYHLQPSDFLETLWAVASAGSVGYGTLKTAKGVEMSRFTLQRRLRQAGLPPLGTLLRAARVAAVEVRIRNGVEETIALEQSGWFSQEAFRRVRRTNDRRLAAESETAHRLASRPHEPGVL